MSAIPSGYWETSAHIPDHERERLRAQWRSILEADARGEKVCIIAGPNMRYVPFSAAAVPDAVCRYCTVANLSSSVWCAGCGAPLVR